MAVNCKRLGLLLESRILVDLSGFADLMCLEW